ncbi:MAG: hypothetical protein ACJAYH_001747 [Celeribacter sp.]|jgi:hypothetical protein
MVKRRAKGFLFQEADKKAVLFSALQICVLGLRLVWPPVVRF